ncbi:MAG: RDD family protein [Actinobacteria bacterium]|nr:RDD family protein [Actinomycetota bacterium]
MIGDEILTGEGVALQVSAASVIARAGAWLIDAVVTGIAAVAGVVLLLSFASDRLDSAAGTAAIYALAALLFLVIPATVETVTRGRSLGKLAFGLQVIRDDGGPVRLRHATVRALVGFFELWLLFGGLAFLVSMLNDRGKRVGDYLAGTYVARVRGVRPTNVPLHLPVELSGWVQVTDIRPLPDALALRARQFLARANQFPPPVRHRLGLRLAAQLELYVSPAAPFGTHHERFVAAVLHERRARDQRALDRTRPRLEAQLAAITTLPYGVPDSES